MIFVKYFRDDLVTGEPDIEVYFSMLSKTDNVEELHRQAVEFSKRHHTATSYRLYEGPHFRSVRAISLQHCLK